MYEIRSKLICSAQRLALQTVFTFCSELKPASTPLKYLPLRVLQKLKMRTLKGTFSAESQIERVIKSIKSQSSGVKKKQAGIQWLRKMHFSTLYSEFKCMTLKVLLFSLSMVLPEISSFLKDVLPHHRWQVLASRGLSNCWGFPSNIAICLPYNINHIGKPIALTTGTTLPWKSVRESRKTSRNHCLWTQLAVLWSGELKSGIPQD